MVAQGLKKSAKDEKAAKLKAAEKLRARQDRFRDLFPKRVERVLSTLDVLGNCSRRTDYEFAPEDIEKGLARVDEAVAELKLRFRPRSTGDRRSFEL